MTREEINEGNKMKTNKELVEHLNNLKILQTSSWDENVPEEIWDEYFKDNHEIVKYGLNVKTHRWYELSTTVIKLNGGFIGVISVTHCYNEKSTIEDMYHYLEFLEMKEVNQPTYVVL